MAQTNSQGDFVYATNRSKVTLNFTNNTVTILDRSQAPAWRSTRKWPLTQTTQIIGTRNYVRIKTRPEMKIECINGPEEFCMPPPVLVPGTRYVYVIGPVNTWEVQKIPAPAPRTG